MSSPERDTQLLSIGKQCAHSSCLLVDFLPFKCYHCDASFCQEHFKVAAHNCPKYDENAHNRVAPNCPLCNVPVAFRPGQDPNDRMEEHFNTDCTVMTGKAAKSKSPVCARASCKKVLFSPISCDKCRRQFCPAHRFPSDHNCTSATSQPAAPGRQAAQSNLLAKFDAKAINAKATGAVDALKKTIPTSSASSQTPAPRPAVTANSSSIASSSKPKPSSPSATNVFSKTDRSTHSVSHNRTVLSPLQPGQQSVSITPVTTSTIASNNERQSPLPSLTNKLSPVIDPLSFKPPSIFATA
ncbi:hypothetical protein AX16_008072 [Volvariella volvacea WC 439]|nr:hypothetical protein AX16_008072 [Volvariella volvacea WC 439]